MTGEDLDALAKAILALAWIGACTTTLFPVLYGVLAPWHRSWLGRAVMSQGIAFAFAMDLTLALHYIRPAHWQLWLVLAVYALVAASTLGVSIVLTVLQIAGHTTRARAESPAANSDG